MTPRIRMTYHAACVLQALAKGARYGFDIMDLTGLPSGTVYPLLRKFEDQGWVGSNWEPAGEASERGRPRRRNYELTDEGHAAVADAADRFRAHERLFSDAPQPAEPAGDAT
jgi:PadR family transcriptional regulator